MPKDTKLGEFDVKNGDKNNTIAHRLAEQQKEISVAEFFEKNRHLLGFDNKRKALLTVVKEAIDNSLDACEEAGILPEIIVEIVDMENDRFRVTIEDNGPGIVKGQIPKIFAKLLYGSKFHRLKMSRGQQGIGISAAVMYAQLTTGRPAKITSKIHPNEPAYYDELGINTQKNQPEIFKTEAIAWDKEHGTKVEVEIEAQYLKGLQSVDEYIKETAVINPHLTLIYTSPKGEQMIFTRVTETMPNEPKEIKPHPYGVEIGILMKMLKDTESNTMQSFLCNDFSRIGPQTAKEILSKAGILTNQKPKDISRQMVEKLMLGIRDTKIIAPPTDCIVPIGSELIEASVKKEVKAEFYASTTRPPEVYRGNPFLIEACIAYGGDLGAEEPARIMRFANRVPLLYQQGACAATKAISSMNWRQYGLSQSSGALPVGPVVILVHVASVWVPFTSEAKEAIAHYPEIIKEIRLALQECGRKLGMYINKKKKVGAELKKKSYIEKYIPHISEALKEITQMSDHEEKIVAENLREILEKTRPSTDLE